MNLQTGIILILLTGSFALTLSSNETATCIEMNTPEQNCDATCEIMAADRAFNARAQETNIPQAFVEFAADDAVMYRNGAEPIVGKDAIAKLLEPEKHVSLVWKPLTCDIAGSKDLGYSRGSFEMNIPATDDTPAQGPIKGYYVSIWKKQSDGSWKWVFDSGIISQIPSQGKD